MLLRLLKNVALYLMQRNYKQEYFLRSDLFLIAPGYTNWISIKETMMVLIMLLLLKQTITGYLIA